MPRAIVVGGGVVGAAVANALAAERIDVLVLEAGVPGGGATAAGMGHIVVMDDSDAQFALTAYSRALLDELLPEVNARAEYQRCGTLWIAEDQEQLQAVRDKHVYYNEHGVRAEPLDAQSLAEAEPNLRPGLAGALLIPDDGVLYPPGLARLLLERAAAHKCEVRRLRVQAIEPHAVITEQGRLQADVIVNAAGAAAPALTAELPIVPRKGHLVVTDRYPGFCRHQLVELGYLHSAHTMNAASVAFNLQPRRTGQMLLGSSRELVGWDGSINRSVLQQML
ncbi:MAG TPA: FAD-dependent oxidoreductase, partial [Longimicrobiales bacterium]